MPSLTKDYGNWGKAPDIFNPDVWILLIIIAFIAAAILVFISRIKN